MAATIGLSGSPTNRDPAMHAAVVTPSDTTDLTYATTSLWLGGIAASATLSVIMAGGDKVTFTFGNAAALAPLTFPIRVTRVMATGTANIANIVALWS
jgi:hypothetical protein